MAKKLLRDEYQAPNLARYNILQSRALIGLGDTEKALDGLNSVIKNNSLSLSSAEATYWIGEMYFTTLLDNAKAKEFFDKVEVEYSRSPFTPLARARSAVVAQIIQYRDPQAGVDPATMVDQQLKLAENYLDILEMPDSALSVYDRIPHQRDFFRLRADSLTTQIDSIEATPDTVFTIAIDSLSVLADSLEIERDLARAAIDSTNTRRVSELGRAIEALQAELRAVPVAPPSPPSVPDSLISPPPAANDSLKVSMASPPDSLVATPSADSLQMIASPPPPVIPVDYQAKRDSLNASIARMMAEIDSLNALPPDPDIARTDSLSAVIRELDARLETLHESQRNRQGLAQMKTDRKTCEETLRNYDETYIPFSMFIKIRVLCEHMSDSLRARETLTKMQTDFPDSRYTHAAELYLSGASPILSTPAELRAEARYEVAERLIEDHPEHAVAEFDSLATMEMPVSEKALLASGWVRFFSLHDSLTAKTRLDSVLAHNPAQDTKDFIAGFYAEGRFLHYDRLPALVDIERQAHEDSLRAASGESEPEQKPGQPNEKDKKKKGGKGETGKTPVEPPRKPEQPPRGTKK
jgi:tetratricopeptide (TPR) repeat protein